MRRRIFSMLMAVIMLFMSVDIQAFAQTTNVVVGRLENETESPKSMDEFKSESEQEMNEMPAESESPVMSEDSEIIVIPEIIPTPENTELPQEIVESPEVTPEILPEEEPTAEATEEPMNESTETPSLIPEEETLNDVTTMPEEEPGMEPMEEPTATLDVSPSVEPSVEPDPLVLEDITRIYSPAKSTGNTGAVSRIEWLQALVDTFDMVVESDNYPDNYYSDVNATDENYHTIMVATEFGLIDVEAGDALEPEAPVTREFAAHSLNVCLGYVPDSDTYTFSESASVDYPDDIQVAVEHFWFNLSGSNFLPEQAITVSEMEIMLQDAEESIAETIIDENYNNQYEFKENVIVLPADTQAEVTDENEITIYGSAPQLAVGDIFALVKDSFPIAKKVKSISSKDGNTVITTESVSTEEAFESIDIQGSLEGDLTAIETLDSNAVLSYIVGGTAENEWEDGTKYDSVEAVGSQKISAVEVLQSYDIPERVRKQYDLGDGVKATISCKITDVYANYNANKLGGNAYLNINATATFSCNVSLDVLDALGVDSKITLVKVPVAGVGYMSVTLDLALKGDITLSLVEYISVGVNYSHDRGFRLVSNFYKKAFTIQAHAEASAGFTASVGIDWVVIKGSIYAKVGAKAILDSETYTDGNLPMTCSHVNAYLYANIGCNVSLDLWIYKDSWGKQLDIYSKKNSPIKVSQHYEDGQPVARCTREESDSSGSGSGSKRWKYYTPADSRYSYSGASSGIGSNGEPFTIFDYSLDADNNATITGYYGNVSALNIPDALDGYKVVGIADKVFKGNTQLRMVVIPDSVTRIGAGAFANCVNISTVQLSNNLVEICAHAFFNCDNLTSIKIPKTLQTTYDAYIYELAYGYVYGPFYGCDGLKNVILEEGSTVVANGLFANCAGLESITIPDTVTVIEEKAFFKCSNLNQVNFSTNLMRIDDNAFAHCSALSSIDIPDSLTRIGAGSFGNCTNLSSVDMSKRLVEICAHAFYNCDKLISIEIPKTLQTTYDAYINEFAYDYQYGPFYGCDGLKNVILEEGSTVVANGLLANCTGLETITIPDTVTVIEEKAFFKCSNLCQINFSNNLVRIDDMAFAYCSILGSIDIPDSVTRIGAGSFGNCTNLSSVDMTKGLLEICAHAFYNCDNLVSIEIPKSLKITHSAYIYEFAYDYQYGPFYGCDGLKTIILEEGSAAVVKGLFANCSGIESVTIPDTVKIIEELAFYNCTNLKQIELKEGLLSLENEAFLYCNSLKEIDIPDTVSGMGTYIFYNCYSLENVHLPDIRKNIPSYTFYNCINLKEINFPDTLVSVQDYAFYNCDALETVDLPKNVTSIGQSAFYDCDGLTTVNMKDAVTTMGNYAFNLCDSLKKVTLSAGLTTIPQYGFANCGSLEEIVLPYKMTTISANAFVNDVKLAKVTIPRNVTSIASTAFSYPANMTIYGVAGTYAETFANDNNITFVNQEIHATAMEVLPENPTVNKGYTKQMTLSVTPSNFTDEIVWKSSDTSVATVDQNGLIKGVGVGMTKIKVSVGDVSKQFTITVLQPVTSIYVSPGSVSLEAGQEKQLSAEVYPSNASDKTYEWSSADESIATVSEAGKVTGISKGTVKIYATAKDGSGKSDYCNVTVTSNLHIVNSVDDFESKHPYDNNSTDAWKYQDDAAKKIVLRFSEETEVEEYFDFIYIYDEEDEQVGKYTGTQLAGKEVTITGKSVRVKLVSDNAGTEYGFKVVEIRAIGAERPLEAITLSEQEISLEKGLQKQLQVSYSPENTTDGRSVSWSSSDEYVATVDENGTVTAVGAGTTTIQAKVGQKTAKCKVTVTAPLTGIEFAVQEVELAVGEKYTIEVTYDPMDTTDSRQLIWTSSNQEVATVDNNGIVNVLGYGETIIEGVSSVNENAKDTCTIYVNQYEVQFDSMGGSAIEPVLCGYKQPLDCAEFIPEKENFIFEGWYKDSEYQEKWTKTDIVTEDITLYAKWQEVKEGFWLMPVEDQTYTGKAIKPVVKVYDGETLLIAKTDYTVSYKNNKKPNDASKPKTAPTITVTGKGNYKGTETVTFKILKKDIADTDITASDIKVAYNKKAQKKVPTVKRGSTSLKKDTDFTVSYPDLATNVAAYKAPGTYTILVKGKGGYTGQREVKLTITESKLMSKVTVSKITTQSYTGAAVTTATMTKAPTVKYGDKTKLKEGIHYTVSYENNINIGTATMILTGTDEETQEGTFTGTKKVTFKIGGTSLAKAKVTGVPISITYTGAEINEQTENWGNPIKVVLNGDELTRAEDAESEGDYIVTFSKNANKGTATVTIKGINAYSGSVKKEFTINAYNINDNPGGNATDNTKKNLVTEEMDTATIYAKGGSKPEPIVKFGDITLVKGKDYTLTYANNTKWHDGTSATKVPTVTITGKGNFKGTVKLTYTIAKQDIGNLKITASDVVYKKEKGAYKAAPVVKDLNNKNLKAKTDYTVSSYTYGQDVTLKNGTERKAGDAVGKNDIVPAGTLLKVAVTGKGNYTNDTPLVAEYRVVKSSIAKATVTVPSQPYTGKAITIDDKTKIKVKVGKTKLDPEDFEIVDGSFKNNTKAGTASFTIRGVGNYGGTKKVTFKIKPKGLIWWWR